ncbi:MAG TPA: DUF1501 domain-containing protein [Pirellulaceae bacterium]|nr:DUF1501 domain-containing protein [Pirellulaceae bacterium]
MKKTKHAMTASLDIRRRDFLNWGTQGLAATALVSLLRGDGLLAADAPSAQAFLNIAPRAKRAIHICLVGGMSHIDSFDYKPTLAALHGKSLATDEKPDLFFGKVGLLRKHDWAFKQRGKSGLWVSEMFPHLAGVADDLTVIRSMVTGSANHTPALFFENSGFEFNGFPSLGSWLSHGLGNESDSLPTYVVLADSRGGPNGGASNWSNGFLPSQHQGVEFRGGKQPVRDLFPARGIDAGADQSVREFLDTVNRRHAQRVGNDRLLTARIRSYELAARMQLSVPEVSDLRQESKKTIDMYGLNVEPTADCGRRCLLGRRLLERGVRFVQLFSGGPIAGNPRASWDAHESVKDNHSLEAARIDQPVAALLRDLKRLGMLDDTLVLFTTEFGRTPFAQSDADKVGQGRDHNRYGFSVWMAGAGLKSGTAFGSTDDVGWKSVESPVTWHDFHATVLHLFGIDHQKLTHYHNGIQRRLTNVHGEVVKGILA